MSYNCNMTRTVKAKHFEPEDADYHKKYHVCDPPGCFNGYFDPASKQGETDVDCGGECEQKCDFYDKDGHNGCREHSDCREGQFCKGYDDGDDSQLQGKGAGEYEHGFVLDGPSAAYGACTPESCHDKLLSPLFLYETDVDCGGPADKEGRFFCAKRCEVGKHCRDNEDCVTNICSAVDSTCAEPSKLPLVLKRVFVDMVIENIWYKEFEKPAVMEAFHASICKVFSINCESPPMAMLQFKDIVEVSDAVDCRDFSGDSTRYSQNAEAAAGVYYKESFTAACFTRQFMHILDENLDELQEQHVDALNGDPVIKKYLLYSGHHYATSVRFNFITAEPTAIMDTKFDVRPEIFEQVEKFLDAVSDEYATDVTQDGTSDGAEVTTTGATSGKKAAVLEAEEYKKLKADLGKWLVASGSGNYMTELSRDFQTSLTNMNLHLQGEGEDIACHLRGDERSGISGIRPVEVKNYFHELPTPVPTPQSTSTNTYTVTETLLIYDYTVSEFDLSRQEALTGAIQSILAQNASSVANGIQVTGVVSYESVDHLRDEAMNVAGDHNIHFNDYDDDTWFADKDDTDYSELSRGVGYRDLDKLASAGDVNVLATNKMLAAFGDATKEFTEPEYRGGLIPQDVDDEKISQVFPDHDRLIVVTFVVFAETAEEADRASDTLYPARLPFLTQSVGSKEMIAAFTAELIARTLEVPDEVSINILEVPYTDRGYTDIFEVMPSYLTGEPVWNDHGSYNSGTPGVMLQDFTGETVAVDEPQIGASLQAAQQSSSIRRTGKGGEGVVGFAAVCMLAVFGVLAVVYRRRELQRESGAFWGVGESDSVSQGITAVGQIRREGSAVRSSEHRAQPLVASL
jgi:hypothetical protein